MRSLENDLNYFSSTSRKICNAPYAGEASLKKIIDFIKASYDNQNITYCVKVRPRRNLLFVKFEIQSEVARS